MLFHREKDEAQPGAVGLWHHANSNFAPTDVLCGHVVVLESRPDLDPHRPLCDPESQNRNLSLHVAATLPRHQLNFQIFRRSPVRERGTNSPNVIAVIANFM